MLSSACATDIVYPAAGNVLRPPHVLPSSFSPGTCSLSPTAAALLPAELRAQTCGGWTPAGRGGCAQSTAYQLQASNRADTAQHGTLSGLIILNNTSSSCVGCTHENEAGLAFLKVAASQRLQQQCGWLAGPLTHFRLSAAPACCLAQGGCHRWG